MRIFCMKCGEILTDVPMNIYTGNPYCPICKSENLEIEEDESKEQTSQTLVGK